MPRFLLAFVTVAALALAGCAAPPEDDLAASASAGGGGQREYTLRAYLSGFVGVGGDVDGVENPTLQARLGDTVRIVLVNGEDLEHDLFVMGLEGHAEHVRETGETSETTLRADERGSFEYLCTVPGHRQAGMHGVLVVK